MTPSTVRNPELLAIPHLDKKSSTIVFVIALIAFVAESELTQYVQTTLHYRQPFFLLYIVHASFFLIFPIHLLYLISTTTHTPSSLLKGLSIAISAHLSRGEKSEAFRFPLWKFLCLTLVLTLGISIPALLWFCSVSLASMTDVTAIWNTNAFFAYVISVKLFKLQWEPKRLLAVVLATLGTFAVVYGGAASSEGTSKDVQSSATLDIKPSNQLLGNLLCLIASFAFGLYTVLYKMYAALPSDPEVAAERDQYEVLQEDEDQLSPSFDTMDAVYPPPFGLHPNLMTSFMGFYTFIILWIPLPFLHWSGVEVFRLPPDLWTTATIGGIGLTGMCFNSAFMVLLGVWGPIITSVGNLLTIVLVLIVDVLFGPGLEVLGIWSLMGCGGIVSAFAILSYETFRKA